MSRILIIDDDACCHDSVRKVLTKAGHCVDDAAGVDRANQEIAFAPGAAAVIKKPVRRKELIDHVMNALSGAG